MKRIFVIMMTGLFLTTGLELTAQPGGNGNNGRRKMKMYMEQNIKPELLKQKKIWMDALTKTETGELLALKNQQEAIRESMSGQQVTPEERAKMRDAHFSSFKEPLEKIVDAHPDLKKQYIREMTEKKAQWMKDMESFNPGFGNRSGMQNIMDRMTDPAFILIWNPQMNYGKMMMHHRHMKQGNRMGMGGQGMRGNRAGAGCVGPDGNKMNKRAMSREPGIHIFPQPAEATTVIKISGVKNKNVEAAVFNAKGKRLEMLYKGTATMPVLDYTLNVSDWDNGIYTVKVTFDNRAMTMDFEVSK